MSTVDDDQSKLIIKEKVSSNQSEYRRESENIFPSIIGWEREERKKTVISTDNSFSTNHVQCTISSV